MPLLLSVLRCPDDVTPEERRVLGGEYVLGRGGECDWALPDPDRVISKRHCTVEFLAGGWQVRDLSTNGTFLNGAALPIGRDQTQALRDGDRLRLGGYEIECRISEEAGQGTGRWESTTAMPDPMAQRPARDGDIFAARLPGLDASPGASAGPAPILPADFDPFAAEDPGPAMPDHAPATSALFAPPRATMPDLLPADWDLVPPVAPSRPPPAVPSPGIDPLDPFAEAPPPRTQPAAPIPAAPIHDPAHDLAPAVANSGLDAALAALLRGAGLPPPPPGADAAQALAQAGALLRAAVAGMRALLIARADVKREFRIEQTMLRAAGNNPLKFAASDDAALQAMLLGPDGGGDAAIRESAEDLAAHQLATVSATQAAARELLKRLAPAGLEADTPAGGLSLPGARERRLWEAYRRLHQQVSDQFEDDFDSAFGKAFARAYEQAARRGG
jgi:type VI secretion system FHA domain protein